MSLCIEYISVSELQEYGANARTHSARQVEQIAASIREFGFTNPVLVDSENILIAGHGRLAAATLIGMDEIPAVRLSGLSPDQVRALRIADNQLALNAGWDLELLAAEVRTLEISDFSLDLLGFEDAFLDDILSGALSVHGDERSGEHGFEPDVPDV